MSNNRIYIAGKMRGIKDFNKYAFNNAEEFLRDAGYEPVNPVNLDEKRGLELVSDTGDTKDIVGFCDKDMKDIIREDVEAVMSCDAIYLLISWGTSKGAIAEKAIAEWLGLRVIYEGMPDE